MTDRELDRLIWLVMQYEGSLPPMTEETVAYWEEKMKHEPPVELQRDSKIRTLFGKECNEMKTSLRSNQTV